MTALAIIVYEKLNIFQLKNLERKKDALLFFFFLAYYQKYVSIIANS